MSVETNAEIQRKQEQKEERKQTSRIFFNDFKTSTWKWFKYGIAMAAVLVLFYLLLRFTVKWDLFYETDWDYLGIFFAGAMFFLIMFLFSVIMTFRLYNAKHRRKTKYKQWG